MSDLIRRSDLLNEFNNKNIQIAFDLPVEEILEEDVDLDDFAMLLQDAIRLYKEMVIDTIKNQPTSYDVGKVVKELELHSFEFGRDALPAHYVRLNKAIEIVKQGGISDDVCEWQQGKGGTGLKRYKASCCDKSLDMPLKTAIDLKYCPYCGKNIKVVK